MDLQLSRLCTLRLEVAVLLLRPRNKMLCMQTERIFFQIFTGLPCIAGIVSDIVMGILLHITYI